MRTGGMVGLGTSQIGPTGSETGKKIVRALTFSIYIYISVYNICLSYLLWFLLTDSVDSFVFTSSLGFACNVPCCLVLNRLVFCFGASLFWETHWLWRCTGDLYVCSSQQTYVGCLIKIVGPPTPWGGELMQMFDDASRTFERYRYWTSMLIAWMKEDEGSVKVPVCPYDILYILWPLDRAPPKSQVTGW